MHKITSIFLLFSICIPFSYSTEITIDSFYYTDYKQISGNIICQFKTEQSNELTNLKVSKSQQWYSALDRSILLTEPEYMKEMANCFKLASQPYQNIKLLFDQSKSNSIYPILAFKSDKIDHIKKSLARLHLFNLIKLVANDEIPLMRSLSGLIHNKEFSNGLEKFRYNVLSIKNWWSLQYFSRLESSLEYLIVNVIKLHCLKGEISQDLLLPYVIFTLGLLDQKPIEILQKIVDDFFKSSSSISFKRPISNYYLTTIGSALLYLEEQRKEISTKELLINHNLYSQEDM